jgi:MFS transporter, MCT family, solute carrier family 16 (monocarboxylic acid transporters), member 10
MIGSSVDPRFAAAPKMLVRSFFAQNIAIGCSFGGFAVSVLAIEARYQSSRAMAEMLLALVLLSMSLLAPLAGGMIVRIGIRMTMMIGVTLSAAGYFALAFAPTMTIALAAAALLIGPGAGMFGSIPASVLASGWYPEARGKALGIANIPLFIALIPLLGLIVIERFDLCAFFLCLAGLHVLLLPFIFGIKEPPTLAAEREDLAPSVDVTNHPLRLILCTALFWLIVVGDGMLNATNITNSAHIIPIAMEGGVVPAAAALLLSVGGAASIFGSILSGLLCDRVGAARTLALAGFGSAISWAIIASTGSLPALIIAMVLNGTCGAAVFPPTNMLVAQIFGDRALPRVLGLLSVFTLPLTFAMSPAVGWIHDIIGNYLIIVITLMIICALVAIQFFLIGRRLDRIDTIASLPVCTN